MCDNYTTNDELPMCPCGGEILLEDNEAEIAGLENGKLLIWGKCQSCGRVGPRFEFADEAFDEAYTWKEINSQG